MKRIQLNIFQNIFTIITIFLFFGCNPSNKSNTKDNHQVSNQTLFSFAYNQKQKSLVSAHRGGHNLKGYPENCIETMDFLYDKGITIFEIDVAKTKDNELILMHDNSLQRTSTGREDVNQINLSKIKEYFLVDDFGSETTFRIPTFEEAIQWGKNKPIYFMIDIKKDVPYKQIITSIRNLQMEKQVVLVSYSVNQAKKLNQLAPEMYLSVSMRNEKEFEEMINSGIPTSKMVAFTGTKRSPKSLFDKIHNENIMVIFGTLGNIDKSAAARGNKIYKELENEGVDIFATDRALEVFQTIN